MPRFNEASRLLLARGVLCISALTGTSPATAQEALVRRSVYVREEPSVQAAALARLGPGDELTLVEPQRTQGYYHVRTASGVLGWVWARNVRLVAAGGPPDTAPAGPPEVYRGCGLEGTAQSERRRALNRLKNRIAPPSPESLNPEITLARMLEPGNDETRWSNDTGAEILGFVVAAKPGGMETVNCGESDPRYRDTHIELALEAADAGRNRRVVVEVTPRWRAFLRDQGVDWSTQRLRQQLVGRCARFAGWLFFDDEHDDEAENTRPGRPDNWRATAWEIHPVTKIEVVPCPG